VDIKHPPKKVIVGAVGAGAILGFILWRREVAQNAAEADASDYPYAADVKPIGDLDPVGLGGSGPMSNAYVALSPRPLPYTLYPDYPPFPLPTRPRIPTPAPQTKPQVPPSAKPPPKPPKTPANVAHDPKHEPPTHGKGQKGGGIKGAKPASGDSYSGGKKSQPSKHPGKPVAKAGGLALKKASTAKDTAKAAPARVAEQVKQTAKAAPTPAKAGIVSAPVTHANTPLYGSGPVGASQDLHYKPPTVGGPGPKPVAIPTPAPPDRINVTPTPAPAKSIPARPSGVNPVTSTKNASIIKPGVHHRSPTPAKPAPKSEQKGQAPVKRPITKPKKPKPAGLKALTGKRA
jgi:hypothetical protein